MDAARKLVRADGQPLRTANPLIVLRRCAVGESDGRSALALDAVPTRDWAVDTNLGQNQPEFIAAVAKRREAAVQSLVRTGVQCVAVTVTADGPVLVGASDRGIDDVGMSLHGTYGWPVLPGSALKGVAHAYARDEQHAPEERRGTTFGAPRPDGNAATEPAIGSVTVLDALPVTPVTVTHDVLTPHVQPYYTGPAPGTDRQPPAEYWQPVPVPFLSVDGGSWTCYLLGKSGTDLRDAVKYLLKAVADIGIGAKTAAGYGYLTAGVPQIVRGGEP